MKMTKEQKKMLVRKFNEKRWKNGYKVELYSITGGMFDDNKPLTYGLNWSAIGTVSVAMTKKFITQLNEAIKIVEKVNRS